MRKAVTLGLAALVMATLLSGCIVPPWWDGGYGGHHHHGRHRGW